VSGAERDFGRARSLWRYGLACFLLVAFACGVLYAEIEAGYYSTMGAQKIDQRMPVGAMADATYGVGTYPLHMAGLEEGDGKLEAEAYCSTCHSPSYIPMQPPLPAETWSAEVNKMMTTHGASIPDEAVQKIVRYLQTHYTPETRKR
jgi:hypothetical protein